MTSIQERKTQQARNLLRRNKQRFIDAATKHWLAIAKGSWGKDPQWQGRTLYACLNAAAGKRTPAQADQMRSMFNQALYRRTR